MSNGDVENIVKCIKKHLRNNFPKGVCVPSPDEANEDGATRFVQKQFKEAGLDCPRDTARGVVRRAWDQVR
ncbi:hypothetical protein [Mycobacterium aquaticum]|uniref:Uncharacterized protein n=1 Tax=Mycobacterium aquaticum TaxID=1927124 RepID=A0A1X0AQ32_9MYCO|nr:hypothetical protein [Mycobacterium aquaticum]ORA31988.1 hypothetical protein BST13_24195 [Mycobacterium aquaticum]